MRGREKITGLNEIRQKARSISITVRIGKNGITESQIAEIKKQLKKRKLVKIKMLRSFVESDSFDKKEAVNEISRLTRSVVVHAVGFVFVLYRE